MQEDLPFDEVELEQADQALFNAITIDSSCDAYRTKVQSVVNLAVKQVRGSDRQKMLTCLREASFASYGNTPPESLLNSLAESVPTYIDCQDLPANVVEQAVPGTEERVTFNKAKLDRDTDYLAAIFLHEIAHTKEFHHPEAAEGGDYDYSVPQQVYACSDSISDGDVEVTPRGDIPKAEGTVRSLFARRTQLAPIGDSLPGVGIFPIDSCSNAAIAQGIEGRMGASLRAINLRCDYIDGLGLIMDTPSRGSTTGTAFELDCGPSAKLVGIHGLYGGAGTGTHYINSIGGYCASENALRSGSATTTTLAAVVGTAGDVNLAQAAVFSRVCPVGFVIKAIGGLASSSYVNNLRVTCQKWSDLRSAALVSSPLAGTTTGYNHTTFDLCANDGAIGQLHTQVYGNLERLAGECRSLARDTSSNLVRDFDTGAPLGGNVPHDEQQATVSRACALAEVMVGLNYYTANPDGDLSPTIVGVAPVCASPTTWANGSTTRTRLAVAGRTGVGTINAGDVLCPAKSFVVGHQFYQSDTDGLVGVRLFCRGF